MNTTDSVPEHRKTVKGFPVYPGHGYMNFNKNGCEVILDGEFTSADLRAFADYMDHLALREVPSACSICRYEQFDTEAGPSCRGGHLNAPALTPETRK